MSDEQHPAPRRDRLSPLAASLLLYIGPLAWFVQLCVGVTLTSWPCFPNVERRTVPLASYGWTRGAAVVVLVLCALAACAAGIAAFNRFHEVREEREGDHDALAEVGHGRTRFVALWATYLGLGFALSTLATLAGFLMVPRCLG
jgi:hypothetical protein